MARITLRNTNNKNVNFIHIINFLLAYRVMAIEEAHSLYKKFKSGEDITFDIPDAIASKFRSELDCLNCNHE